jgi:ribosomal protein S18 acetylase RimI-like enzyme
MADWLIEPLDRHHVRSAFSCGKPPLDEFIRNLVSQYQKRNLGRTYVAVRSGDPRVFGYVTLASSSVPFINLPLEQAKKLPRHPVPVILLARLAVDQTVQGQRLGEILLLDALERCAALAVNLGVHAVEVQAIDAQARSLYEKYGFEALIDDQLHLILPIATIRDATRSYRKKV